MQKGEGKGSLLKESFTKVLGMHRDSADESNVVIINYIKENNKFNPIFSVFGNPFTTFIYQWSQVGFPR
jgi:hypothetical protein